MNKKIDIILAIDEKNGLGKNGDLAWKLSSDMKYFKKITSKTFDKNKKNAIIMGRKTWESIPSKFRPLPGRLNCILSRKIIKYKKNTLWFTSLEDCIKRLEGDKTLESVFIIGGARLYNDSLKNPSLDKIYITKVSGNFNCDLFFDGIPNNFKLESKSETKKENDIKYHFEIWKK